MQVQGEFAVCYLCIKLSSSINVLVLNGQCSLFPIVHPPSGNESHFPKLFPDCLEPYSNDKFILLGDNIGGLACHGE